MSAILKCEYCDKDFVKKRRTSRYCSRKCGTRAWNKNFKLNGYVKKNKKKEERSGYKKREIIIANCPICNSEFRKTRSDKMTCGQVCRNKFYQLKKRGVVAQSFKNNYVSVDNIIVDELKPYLLDWKKRKFLLNEIDLFTVIHLWDKLFPYKFIPDNINREELFEGMIMDLIFHYKKYKDNKQN
jgi:hypothetical protein